MLEVAPSEVEVELRANGLVLNIIHKCLIGNLHNHARDLRCISTSTTWVDGNVLDLHENVIEDIEFFLPFDVLDQILLICRTASGITLPWSQSLPPYPMKSGKLGKKTCDGWRLGCNACSIHKAHLWLG
jgi:hypothetical protein